MKVSGHKKMVAELFVTVDGYTVRFNDLFEVVEQLLDCDGFTEAVVIYSDEVALLLGAGGYARKNSRGSWYRTDKTEALYDELLRLLGFPMKG